ncbi:TetR/AcrR family transcriptional regulator [Pendulispora brunnea]|uniref:TetR/AcrR family transcriptional regulator n=1 Tax=Pendulispora brunnea TaxID=2905690 RepID=A0ABZ2KGT3_9BACT
MERPLRNSSRKKREAMVEAATRLFLEYGFEGVSMDTIAEQANVSKRTLYNHFNDKYALFEAVMALLCESVLPWPGQPSQGIQGSQGGGLNRGEVRDTLEKLGVAFLGSIYAPIQIELYRTVVHDTRRFPQLGLMMLEGPIRRSHKLVSEYLRAWQAAGEIDVSDPDLAAAQFVGMLKADVQMKLLFDARRKVSPGEIRRLARTAVELFLNGAGPKKRRAAVSKKTPRR